MQVVMNMITKKCKENECRNAETQTNATCSVDVLGTSDVKMEKRINATG